MANYTASALTAAQVAFQAKFNDPELRRKQNPALMLGLKNQQVTVVSHKELKSKYERPVKAYIRTKRAAAATAAKTHNHTGTKGDSKEVTLSFIQIVEPFTVHLKQAQGNILKYSEMLQHEIMESAKNIHDRAGTLALAYLQSNRTQLAAPATGGAGTWNAANFALEVAADKKDFFYQNVASFMRKQSYRGTLDLIADQIAFRQSQYINAQGQANNTNLAFQIANMNIAETTEEIDANYQNGSVLVTPEGGFAALPWNDPVNAGGKGDFDSVLGGYGSILDPLGSGLLLDVHGYTTRVDGSAAGGSVQDEAMEMEVSLTIAWILAPLSTANETPVWEVAQAIA
jgi:hypothetical protein